MTEEFTEIGEDVALERLVTFEIGANIYAIPILDVLEICETVPLFGVPTLSRQVGGVMNHHGEALPVINRSIMFDLEGADLWESEHVIVLAGESEDAAGILGIPVDRILGLSNGPGGARTGEEFVSVHFPQDGRMVSVLDTHNAVEKARCAINQSVGSDGRAHGGEA